MKHSVTKLLMLMPGMTAIGGWFTSTRSLSASQDSLHPSDTWRQGIFIGPEYRLHTEDIGYSRVLYAPARPKLASLAGHVS